MCMLNEWKTQNLFLNNGARNTIDTLQPIAAYINKNRVSIHSETLELYTT